MKRTDSTNTLRQQRWRDRQKEKRIAAGEVVRTRSKRPRRSAGKSTDQEIFRAGLIAGRLEVCLSYGVPFRGEGRAREWLDNHPVGEFFVLDVLSVAGLRSDFLRWRGLR